MAKRLVELGNYVDQVDAVVLVPITLYQQRSPVLEIVEFDHGAGAVSLLFALDRGKLLVLQDAAVDTARRRA